MLLVREHHHQSLWGKKDQTLTSNRTTEVKERETELPSEAHQSKSLSGRWNSDPAGDKDPAEEGAMILKLKSMAEGKHTSHTLAANEGLDFWLVCLCVCV